MRSERVAPLILGRDICGDWTTGIAREWLVTNGLGGYACGTLAGANTRRYHGFLIASLEPPVGRTLLVAKTEPCVLYRGRRYPLFANEFEGGTVDPKGFIYIESFMVRDGMPTWRFAIADALLEQSVFMAPGANTSYLRLEVLRAGAPLGVELKPLVTQRDHHWQLRGTRPFTAAASDGGCVIQVGGGAPICHLRVSSGRFVASDTWYWNFLHREEQARGLDSIEDLWGPGTFSMDLAVGQPAYFCATAGEPRPAPGEEVRATLIARSQRLIGALPKSSPSWVQTLATASDQFIVQRGASGASSVGAASVGAASVGAASVGAASMSVIAGYPWFTDWGRDTMISLPGLTTTLGRFDTAAAILRTYAGVVDRGMLPNRFPDAGGAPEYNTADATLWMFQAVSEHLDATGDAALARELFPTLASIIHAHVEGTRYGIRVDPADGLLRAGEAGVQLTWMDAKKGDHVFTPRVGKPVEINALWLNALAVTLGLAEQAANGAEADFCRTLLLRAQGSFGRFWNPARGCLYDVLDVDGGSTHDASIRPNQLFAVSLPHGVLPPDQQRAVVETCARDLLTSFGLRSLAVDDPAFIGRYEGDIWQRDSAYHQGTVWSWLLGPFARAHHRVFGDARQAQQFLAPIAQHLAAAGIGQVSEVFDGDAPHVARGCFAQAWGVAEILRSWVFLERQVATV
jgi:predicted glycogen debranching enzyme